MQLENQEIFQKPCPLPEINALSRALATGDFSDFNFGSNRPDPNSVGDPSTFKEKRLQRASAGSDLSTAAGMHRYDDRTHELLASYFEGTIDRAQRVELAGLLVFPANTEGAELVSGQIKGKLSAEKEARLVALANYPDHPRAAELLTMKLTGGVPPTLQEQAEFYSLQAFKDMPAAALQLNKEIQRVLGPVHEGKTGEEAVKRMILNFVRREIDLSDNLATSLEGLAELFKVSPPAIAQMLADPKDGLTAEQSAVRDDRLVLTADQSKQALSKLRISALRNVVYIENDLHRSGFISQLSSPKELAELFGVTPQTMGRYLMLLQPEEADYRALVMRSGPLAENKSHLLDAIRREVAANRTNKVNEFRTDSELAAAFGMHPMTVYHLLREHLPQPDREVREFFLRSRKPAEEYSLSAVVFVRTELAALKAGEINRLTNTDDLARIFNVPVGVIVDTLNDSAAGLSIEDRKSRDFILSLQKPNDFASEALRMVASVFIKESIEKHRNKARGEAASQEAPDADPEGEAETVRAIENRPRNKIEFRGLRYDSLEEAVCSVMMSKYIKGYTPIEGKTFQVQLTGRFIDFVLEGVVVEYHPILPFWSRSGIGSFKSREDYESFNRVKASIRSMEKKKLFIDETKAQLAEAYKEERQAIIDASSSLRGYELVVAESPEDFYYAVVRRFGQNVPSKALFMREFNKIKARIRQEQKEL